MIPSVEIPCDQIGEYKVIKKFVRSSFNFSKDGRYIPDGEYTFLYHGKCLS